MSELFTESALVDRVKETWHHFKHYDYRSPGDYYYHIIDYGVFNNNTIDINVDHIPENIRQVLNELPEKVVHEVITRAILDYFMESRMFFDRTRMRERIRWRWV